MSEFRIGHAAQLLGVSVDTVRRWVDDDVLAATRTPGGHRVIAGVDLAAHAQAMAAEPRDERAALSARNRFTGLVTRVISNDVSAQVEIQAGPHRIVSLHTAEAVRELGLEPGVLAVAAVKATNVVIERP